MSKCYSTSPTHMTDAEKEQAAQRAMSDPEVQVREFSLFVVCIFFFVFQHAMCQYCYIFCHFFLFACCLATSFLQSLDLGYSLHSKTAIAFKFITRALVLHELKMLHLSTKIHVV